MNISDQQQKVAVTQAPVVTTGQQNGQLANPQIGQQSLSNFGLMFPNFKPGIDPNTNTNLGAQGTPSFNFKPGVFPGGGGNIPTATNAPVTQNPPTFTQSAQQGPITQAPIQVSITQAIQQGLNTKVPQQISITQAVQQGAITLVQKSGNSTGTQSGNPQTSGSGSGKCKLIFMLRVTFCL